MNLEELNDYDQSQVGLTNRAQKLVKEITTVAPALSNSGTTILSRYHLQTIGENIKRRSREATKIVYNDGRFLADLKNTSVPELVKNLIVHNKAEEDNGGVKKAIVKEKKSIILMAPSGILKARMFDESTRVMTENVIVEEDFNIIENGKVSPVTMIFTLPAHQVPVLDSIPEALAELTRGIDCFEGGFKSNDPKFKESIETLPKGFFIYKRRIFCVMKIAPTGDKKISLYQPKDTTKNQEALDGFIRIHATKPYEPEEVELPESYYKLKFPPNLNFEQA